MSKLLNMDPIEETKKAYNIYAKDYAKNLTHNYVDIFLKESFDLFLKELKGKKILDIGSGTGRDSLILKKNGLKPICIDISSSMVEICKSKGLEAYEMNMQNIQFENSYFDGVWAYASLLHLPKNEIPKVIKQIFNVLKPKGIFFLALREGDFDGLKENKKYPGSKRHFSLFSKNEIKLLLNDFEIIYFSESQISSERVYFNIILKKQNIQNYKNP